MAKERAPPKCRLTDAERHVRFVEMAKQVGASDDPRDFDLAFAKVTHSVKSAAAQRRPKAKSSESPGH